METFIQHFKEHWPEVYIGMSDYQYIKESLNHRYMRMKRMSYDYYILGITNSDSDHLFDRLKAEAVAIEQEYPQHKPWNSPTSWVGYNSNYWVWKDDLRII